MAIGDARRTASDFDLSFPVSRSGGWGLAEKLCLIGPIRVTWSKKS